MARRGFAAFVLVAGVALVLASAGLATTKTTLALTSFSDLVVDDAHGHVFVTGGPGSSSIVVLDFSGQVVGTIPGQQGAAGMALDAANSRLYVALSDWNAIAVIDTATLAEAGRISIAPAAGARNVSLAGGRLWFSHDCSSSTSRFGSIALNGTDLQQYARGGNYPFNCLVMAVNPLNQNVLAVSGQGSSPPNIYVYDVTTAVPTVTVWKRISGSGDFDDLTFTPDGLSLLGAAGSPYALQKFQVSDLATTGTYPTGSHPNAAAVTSDGAYVAGGVNSNSGLQIAVYPAASVNAVRYYDVGAGGTQLYSASLAFSADSTKLFSVAKPGSTGGVIFRVHGSPTVVPTFTTTTLAASKASTSLNGTVKLTAQVAGASGGTMSIYATPLLGLKKLVASGPVTSGVFTTTVKVKATTVYIAEYTGDDNHVDSASAARMVKVRPRVTIALSGSYRRSGKYRLYHRGRNPGIKGTVTPSLAASRLTFVAQVYRGGRWRAGATDSFSVNGSGVSKATLYRTTVGRYRVRVIFKGDSYHLKNASGWAYIQITN